MKTTWRNSLKKMTKKHSKQTKQIPVMLEQIGPPEPHLALLMTILMSGGRYNMENAILIAKDNLKRVRKEEV